MRIEGAGLWVSLLVVAAAACAGGSASSPVSGAGSPGSAGSDAAIEGGATSAGAGAATAGGDAAGGGHAPAGSSGETAVGGEAMGSGSAPRTLLQIVAEYESWRPLSAAPFDVSAEILSLCRAPSANESAFLESEHGGFALRHWANPEAYTSLHDDSLDAFLGGSALVKQKIAYRISDGMPEVVALGIMVKRGVGFSASTGDWEFAYYTESDGVLADAETQLACAPCHASPTAKDFVFLDDSWRLE